MNDQDHNKADDIETPDPSQKEDEVCSTSPKEETDSNGVAKNTEESIESLKADIYASKAQYLRLYADFENLRKRGFKERENAAQGASERILKNILSIVDDFERAIASTVEKEKTTELFVGVGLIHKKLTTFLENSKVKVMQVKPEDKFDPNLHEAITSMPNDDESKRGAIVEVVERGYYLNENVLRFAKVIIAG